MMQHGGISPRHQLDGDLDREQHERRHERDDEREQHDVERRRAAHREELRVLAEDVEERLCEREAGDGEQLRTAGRGHAEPTPQGTPHDHFVPPIPRSRDSERVPIAVSWQSTYPSRGRRPSLAL